MTAKILAILGALGILTTIWTTDFRYFWTGIILLLVSIGIASTREEKQGLRRQEVRDALDRIGRDDPRNQK